MRLNINILGDFCVKSLGNLHCGDLLSNCISKADLNVVNLEAPIFIQNATPAVKSGPHLSQDEGVPTFLEKNGFNVVLLANNHMMDYGETAFSDTVKHFSSQTLSVGAGTFEEAYCVKIAEVNHVKIGFLNISQYEFGMIEDNGVGQKVGVAWMLHPCIDELIVNAQKTCDYLIVLPHAGLEFFDLPLPEIRSLYRHFVNMGADAVIGGHPHVPQSWEMYHGKPILYSLGNFCFDKEDKHDMWYDGLIANLSISDGGIEFNTQLIHFDRSIREIEICDNSSIFDRLASNAQLLLDEKKYSSVVNQKCLSLVTTYNQYFEMGGYYQIGIRKSLGHIRRYILSRLGLRTPQHVQPAHMINNLRCETHRWVLSRIYELTH